MSYPTVPPAGSALPSADLSDLTLNPAYTYGESIAAVLWVYLKAADGKIWKGSATTQAHVDAFVGITIISGVLNDTAAIYGPGKLVTGLSGLTAGSPVYLGNSGALSMTPGTFPFRVGVAKSTTSMLIDTFNERFGMNPYGDGSDGALALDGTNTYAAFLSKASAVYTALRDLYVTDIVGSGGAILDMAGFQLNGNGTLSGTLTIRNNGSAGSAGGASNTSDASTRGEGGAAGAAAPGITIPAPGASGAGGKSDYDSGADGGVAGTTVAIGHDSTAGATGGTGGSGAGGGAGGSVTLVTGWRHRSVTTMRQWWHVVNDALVVVRIGPGSGGGGGGGLPGGAGTPSGGGGGGAGGAGGGLAIAFANIIGTITFQAKGGAGGAGGAGNNGTVPKGGGGGAGGNGGRIWLTYRYTSGYTTDVTGGAAGAGGTTSGGTNGAAGSAGNAGAVVALITN